MSKKFALTGFLFCGVVAAFYLYCWIESIIKGVECSNNIVFITLLSGFLTGIYGFMYFTKRKNEKKLKEYGSNERPTETVEQMCNE